MQTPHALRPIQKWTRLVFPGALVFVAMITLYIVLRALSFWRMLFVLLAEHGLMPISLGVALIGIAIFQWRRHWISGLSVLIAPMLVLLLGAVPNGPSSPVGLAANVARVFYFRDELRDSYLAAKGRGEVIPVGQIYLDGFGSLTSGLAYDPSGEIALPLSKRSNGWLIGPGNTELGLANLEVHHIFGAYYYWFHD